MTRIWIFSVGLAISMTIGCSRTAATPAVAAAAVQVSQAGMAASLPSLPGTQPASAALPGEPGSRRDARNLAHGAPPAAASTPASPFPEMVDLFAPPKIVVPVVTKEPEVQLAPRPEPTISEPKKEKPLPPLRLIGFVEVEGLKALLSVEGKLNVVTIGDSTEGLRIIAIEPPAITLRQGEGGEEFQMNLFDQPWFHSTGALAGERRRFGGKPVLPGASALPSATTVGRGATTVGVGVWGGAETTNGISTAAALAGPPVPGLGAPLGPPGFLGLDATAGAPNAPGFQGSGLPGVPGQNAPPSSNGKGSIKSSKTGSSAQNSPQGRSGIPSVPGVNGLPGAAPTK